MECKVVGVVGMEWVQGVWLWTGLRVVGVVWMTRRRGQGNGRLWRGWRLVPVLAGGDSSVPGSRVRPNRESTEKNVQK